MQILSTNGGILNFIPREDISSLKSYEVKITSENTKQKFIDSDPIIEEEKFYNKYLVNPEMANILEEGVFYILQIKNITDEKLIFRDMIFCTDQYLKDYKMTKGLFTEHETGDNEFIYYTEN